jgi:hypothetical protein
VNTNSSSRTSSIGDVEPSVTFAVQAIVREKESGLHVSPPSPTALALTSELSEHLMQPRDTEKEKANEKAYKETVNSDVPLQALSSPLCLHDSNSGSGSKLHLNHETNEPHEELNCNTVPTQTHVGQHDRPTSELRKSQPRKVFQSILHLSSLSSSSGLSYATSGDSDGTLSPTSVSMASASTSCSTPSTTTMTPISTSSSEVERGRSPKQQSTLSASTGATTTSGGISRATHASHVPRINASGDAASVSSPPLQSNSVRDVESADARVDTVNDQLPQFQSSSQPMLSNSGSGALSKKGGIAMSSGMRSNFTSGSGTEASDLSPLALSSGHVSISSPHEDSKPESKVDSSSPVASPSSSPSHANSQPININTKRKSISPRLGQSGERVRKERKRDSQDRISPRPGGTCEPSDSKKDSMRRESSRDSLLRDVVLRDKSKENLLRLSNPNGDATPSEAAGDGAHVSSLAREHSRGKRSSSPRKSSGSGSRERSRKGSSTKESKRSEKATQQQAIGNDGGGANLTPTQSANRLSHSAPIALNVDEASAVSPSKRLREDRGRLGDEKDGVGEAALLASPVPVQSSSYSETDAHLANTSHSSAVNNSNSPVEPSLVHSTSPPSSGGRSNLRRSSSRGIEKKKMSSSHVTNSDSERK